MITKPVTATNEALVEFPSLGRKIFVLSDLHLASGLNKNGNYDGTENFYADQSFVRLIDHLEKNLNGDNAILIINGDFIDFLRICDYPLDKEEFLKWQEILDQSGIKKSTAELANSIVAKEKEFGLKTHDYKSIWKLYVCSKGHQSLFARIAEWVRQGNELIIVKGNHDLEWYWPAVQNYLRYRMAELADEKRAIEKAFQKIIASHIHFVDDAMLVDDKIYIEHGHRYERTTAVVGNALIDNGEELSLPFGSFFNRYLINRLELTYPFLDNVRPSQNILPILLRERFPLGIKVLLHYLPFTLLIIPKKMYWYTFKYLLNIFFIIVLPIGITAFAIYKQVKSPVDQTEPSFIVKQVLSVAKNFGFLFLSYIFGRLLSMAGLKSPPGLSTHAKEILEKHPQVEAVLMGHTHDPEQKNLGNNKWYFNTGTWIPIFETSSAEVRQDKTYTFIAIDPNEKPPCRERLQRWNDDALRIDQMNLNDKK